MPESVKEIKPASTGEPPQWALTTRYIAAIGLIILGIIGLLLLPIIQVLFIAFVISYLMYLPSRALKPTARYRLPARGIPAVLREINNLLITLVDAWALFLAALENYQPGDLVLSQIVRSETEPTLADPAGG